MSYAECDNFDQVYQGVVLRKGFTVVYQVSGTLEARAASARLAKQATNTSEPYSLYVYVRVD